MPPRKQFPLRIDPQLWEAIQRLAAADLRSVNSEVEFLLREAVERRARQGGDGLARQPESRAGGAKTGAEAE